MFLEFRVEKRKEIARDEVRKKVKPASLTICYVKKVGPLT